MAVEYNLVSIKVETLNALPEFSKRGLYHTAKWLAEVLFTLKDVKLADAKLRISSKGISAAENDKYLVAHSYFVDQEYDRCEFYLKNTDSPVCKFLRYYAAYMSLEMKKLLGTTDTNLFSHVPDCGDYLNKMQELCSKLKIAYINNELDGFSLYVYGLVLKKLNHFEDARDVLIESIQKETLNWAAWLELTPLIEDKDEVKSLALPDHWIKDFFIGHLLVDLHLYKEAEDGYKIILNNGFHTSQYVLGQIATCQYNYKDMKSALNVFNEIRKADPFRLEHMDTFSDLLYVAETQKALSFLAHSVTEIDKYRVETSYIIGNYYSMRGEHSKAILSFQRAVKMNPTYVSAWTLMGHEYMEVKNISATILSYQKAISSNKKDYRAWYGLGQNYEMSKLWNFALYYFKIAHKLKPHDSRMLIGLGDVYDKLSKFEETYKCYKQARNVDKNDPLAIIRMARLMEQIHETELAAAAWADLVNEKTDVHALLAYQKDFIDACTFLAKHFVTKKDLDQAKYYANQLRRHAERPEFADAYERTMQLIAPKKKDGIPTATEGESRRNRQILNLEESIRQLFPW